jgi:hypothetical protein
MTKRMTYLELVEGNGVPFTATMGLTLAQAPGGVTVAAVIEQGQGQVLVLADVGMLDTANDDLINLPFWRNLADYARK